MKRIIYVSIVLIGVYLIINLTGSIVNLWQKQEKVEIAQIELGRLQKENKDLTSQLEYSQTAEFLEQQAREGLGLVLPGEKKVIIDTSFIASSSSQSSQAKSWWANWRQWWSLFW